jgi:GT2 family glycosyltransferase
MARRQHPEPPSPEFSPVRIHDVEIGIPLERLEPGTTEAGQPFGSCLCLVRLHGRPLGTVEVPLPAKGVESDELARRIGATLGSEIDRHLREDGLELSELTAAGIPGPAAPRCVEHRERMLENPPTVSVVIVTRGRPQRVLRTIRSILDCRYPHERYDVIVVDTPEDGEAPLDFSDAELPADATVRVVVEPEQGISRGRNRGLWEASGEIVVFADDDVDVDENWLPTLIAGFELGDRVDAVSGPTLPAAIETPTERWFEGFGGLQRGYETRVYDLDDPPADQPLFPFIPGALGSGRSMAFRRDPFRALGGFDVVLGPPTPTLAGEDIEGLLRFVLAGRQVVHEPAALVWHAHPREYGMLRRRMWGYGLGLSACVTKSVVERPRLVPTLLRKLPQGLAFALSPRSDKNKQRQGDYPRELILLELGGLALGPFAYVRSRRQQRRRANGRPAQTVTAESS